MAHKTFPPISGPKMRRIGPHDPLWQQIPWDQARAQAGNPTHTIKLPDGSTAQVSSVGFQGVSSLWWYFSIWGRVDLMKVAR